MGRYFRQNSANCRLNRLSFCFLVITCRAFSEGGGGVGARLFWGVSGGCFLFWEGERAGISGVRLVVNYNTKKQTGGGKARHIPDISAYSHIIIN